MLTPHDRALVPCIRITAPPSSSSPLTRSCNAIVSEGMFRCSADQIMQWRRLLQHSSASWLSAGKTRSRRCGGYEFTPPVKEFQERPLPTDRATGEHPVISPADLPRIYTQLPWCDAGSDTSYAKCIPVHALSRTSIILY